MAKNAGFQWTLYYLSFVKLSPHLSSKNWRLNAKIPSQSFPRNRHPMRLIKLWIEPEFPTANKCCCFCIIVIIYTYLYLHAYAYIYAYLSVYHSYILLFKFISPDTTAVVIWYLDHRTGLQFWGLLKYQ